MRERVISGPPAAERERGVYDAIGIGFGPANMALAVAMEEAAEAGGPGLTRLFLDKKPEHCWHPGMLLEESLIQISVLKDLATVRNPCSRFSFLNYLKLQGRLFEFLNLRDLFPTRLEFNDYLGWVAQQLEPYVRYGTEVLEVGPVGGAGEEVELLRVRVRSTADGREGELLARNLILAPGGVPWVPESVELRPDGRAFHANEFRQRIERDYPDRDAAYRFVVVGAGQSGAELFYYLGTRFRNATVVAALRGFGYKPVDDSDFTNEVFFPQNVDLVYGLPDELRKKVIGDFRDVNYAVVDVPLIRKIYRFLYDERVLGRQRCRVEPFVELTAIEEGADSVRARFHHLLDGRSVEVPADGVVLATGFRWLREHPVLEPLAPHLERDAGGAYRLERDYRIATRPGFRPRVFVQGLAEETHGISETVMSLLPVRAEKILESLVASRAEIHRSSVEVGKYAP